MKKLLHIVATPREEDSRTLQISEVFLEAFLKQHDNYVFEELNLTKENLPSLSQKRVDGKYLLLAGENLYGGIKEHWEEILLYIEQFLSADLYLISSPMWNFNIPYMFKHYIDLIVQPKYLFHYTKTGVAGVEGLAKNKKMIVITSRGGNYDTETTQGLDFQEPYLRAIFGFVGIHNITFINAQPTDQGDEKRKSALEQAKREAKRLAEEFEA